MIYGQYTICKAINTAGYEDENGDFHQSELQWGEQELCDIKSLGKAAINRNGDGDVSTYSYEITLECDCQTYLVGDLVRFTLDEQVVYAVKGFHRYKTYSRLWV